MIKNHIIFNKFSEYRFNLVKAKGSYLWDDQGNKYIDFTSGWNVANLGWGRKEITQAIVDQAKELTYSPMWTLAEIQTQYAKDLLAQLPRNLNTISRVNAGAEANEHAIKIARAFTKRHKILGFYESYHGANLTTMSISHYAEWTPRIIDNREGYVQLAYPNTYRTSLTEAEVLEKFSKELEAELKKENIAAVITESGIITGWGSTYKAPKGFLKSIRQLTEKYNTLLILDEVGTGFSRTGTLFGMQHEQVVPDIVTFAKAIANGALPIGAVVTTEKIANEAIPYAQLQSTFGWNPLACAAAAKTLEIHVKEKVWEQAKTKGEYILKTLKKELKNNQHIGDIRGMGMEIGLDFVKDKSTKEKDSKSIAKVVENADARGLHLVHDLDSNVQIMPPLTISHTDLDKGLDILIDSIQAI